VNIIKIYKNVNNNNFSEQNLVAHYKCTVSEEKQITIQSEITKYHVEGQ
jgi:hypothetical protein